MQSSFSLGLGQTDGRRLAFRVTVQQSQPRDRLFNHACCQQYEQSRQCEDEPIASDANLSQRERLKKRKLMLSKNDESDVNHVRRHFFLFYLWVCSFYSQQHETPQGRNYFITSSWVVRPKLSLTCPVSLLAALVKHPEEDSGDDVPSNSHV